MNGTTREEQKRLAGDHLAEDGAASQDLWNNREQIRLASVISSTTRYPRESAGDNHYG